MLQSIAHVWRGAYRGQMPVASSDDGFPVTPQTNRKSARSFSNSSQPPVLLWGKLSGCERGCLLERFVQAKAVGTDRGWKRSSVQGTMPRRREERTSRQSALFMGAAASLVLFFPKRWHPLLVTRGDECLNGKAQRHWASPHWNFSTSSNTPQGHLLSHEVRLSPWKPNILLMLRAALVGGKGRIYCSILEVARWNHWETGQPHTANQCRLRTGSHAPTLLLWLWRLFPRQGKIEHSLERKFIIF